MPFLGIEPLALQKQGSCSAGIEPLTPQTNAFGGTNYTKRSTYTKGAKTSNKGTGIEPQALQSNFIDGSSFRDEIEIGSSSTTQPTEQAPRASLQYTHNIPTCQTDLQGPHLYRSIESCGCASVPS